MQFKNPEILYALFLLLIPILIHLFQLRRFKKTPFSNVAFLEKIIQNTRKSSSLKKWLVLCTRILALGLLILAFAQPFFPATETAVKPRETVIFIDNSFSMQANGKKGNLLNEAKQDLLTNLPQDERLTLVTWDNVIKDFDPTTDRNLLLDLDFTGKTTNAESLLLRLNTYFANDQTTAKQLIIISDFQDIGLREALDTNQVAQHRVILQSATLENYAIDSLSLQGTGERYNLNVMLRSSFPTQAELPVSLFNKDKLIAKASVQFKERDTASVNFQLDTDQAIAGKLSIADPDLRFDNDFYFSINKTNPLKVLAISNADDDFLRRLYKSEEYQFTTVFENQLDYGMLSEQNLIILNEPQKVPAELANLLKTHTQQGGALILIPAMDVPSSTYSNLLNTFGFSGFSEKSDLPQRITDINYDHPLYQNVFNGRSSNLQSHVVQTYFPLEITNSILSLENGAPFLTKINNLYVFTGGLNITNSNFINGQLIVPTFDKIAKTALSLPQTYYTLGTQNSFDINITIPEDAVVVLEKDNQQFIPLQEKQGNKIRISAKEGIEKAGLYALKFKNDTLATVAYNYNRSESKLQEVTLEPIKGISENSNIPDLLNTLEEETNLNFLYKWFVIFALLAFVLEMFILKKFK
ncbi:vWA domain-containing protein [Leeuwenhoekiella marinoflava]|uniref:N-terminal double-transmembrane domain-containing protein n=2 Tax=Leeuwenhoekiella marinoflava TaxID=988 RepID=A0ABY1HM35_9FLAO|nr:BatA and WFA domain-containing protein [Leeuwenhoekiella marinoflava]RXG32694.1 putative membrane protein (TIGR02226 family) [Leeuwenhoekiella marinoflava]SHE53698.1 N-terminal double-transmembrane domain-containing protein [Leeuwenhoekiella marinoflava DSM 3653]